MPGKMLSYHNHKKTKNKSGNVKKSEKLLYFQKSLKIPKSHKNPKKCTEEKIPKIIKTKIKSEKHQKLKNPKI